MFPCALLAALALGLFLQWPSLKCGFRGDDYVQRAMFRGEFPSPRSAFDLFSFAAGTPQDHQRLVDFGHLPWWSHPELRLRMWRPLASGLMALDFALFDRRAELHHVHSLLWFGLLLVAAGRLLFRVLPPAAAGIALLLYASGPCHTLPVGWLANRSTLCGTALAFFALESCISAADSGKLRRKLACALITALALLCGEYALAATLYGLAFGLIGSAPDQPRRQRLQAVLPIALPLFGYLVLHTLVGSDIVHSGYYISPIGSPWAFAKAVLARVPVLAGDLLFGLPSLQYSSGSPWRAWLLESGWFDRDAWQRLPDWTTWQTSIGYLAIASGFWCWRALRKQDNSNRALDWLVLGAAASLVPCAGSIPEDRLLVAASLGGYALVASVLVQVFQRPFRFSLAAGVRGLLALWIGASSLARSHDDVLAVLAGSDVARAWALDADMPDAQHAAATRVYVLSSADFNTAVNLPWMRLSEADQPVPLSYRRLSAGPMPLDISRPSDRVLEFNVLARGVHGSAVPSLYRDERAPVRKGERHALPGVVVEVTEALDDNPSRLRFEFDRSLDDPSLFFVFGSDQGLRRREPPRIGETLRLPFAAYTDRRR